MRFIRILCTRLRETFNLVKKEKPTAETKVLTMVLCRILYKIWLHSDQDPIERVVDLGNLLKDFFYYDRSNTIDYVCSTAKDDDLCQQTIAEIIAEIDEPEDSGSVGAHWPDLPNLSSILRDRELPIGGDEGYTRFLS
jgi:hypothetical protein